jgi:hypothetical protein
MSLDLCERWLFLILVQILQRHVIFRNLVGTDFVNIRLWCVFDTFYNVSLEGLSLIYQFFHTLGVDFGGVGESLIGAGLTRGIRVAVFRCVLLHILVLGT